MASVGSQRDHRTATPMFNAPPRNLRHVHHHGGVQQATPHRPNASVDRAAPSSIPQRSPTSISERSFALAGPFRAARSSSSTSRKPEKFYVVQSPPVAAPPSRTSGAGAWPSAPVPRERSQRAEAPARRPLGRSAPAMCLVEARAEAAGQLGTASLHLPVHIPAEMPTCRLFRDDAETDFGAPAPSASRTPWLPGAVRPPAMRGAQSGSFLFRFLAPLDCRPHKRLPTFPSSLSCTQTSNLSTLLL